MEAQDKSWEKYRRKSLKKISLKEYLKVSRRNPETNTGRNSRRNPETYPYRIIWRNFKMKPLYWSRKRNAWKIIGRNCLSFQYINPSGRPRMQTKISLIWILSVPSSVVIFNWSSFRHMSLIHVNGSQLSQDPGLWINIVQGRVSSEGPLVSIVASVVKTYFFITLLYFF